MVTADINRERRLSSAADSEEDEKNNRIFQAHLNRLYLEQAQHNHQSYSTYRSKSPAGSRDMYTPSNTVPVYRHGRKFYVPIEEYERIRAEERRHRRNQVHRAQNLPLPKSQATPVRSVSTSYYNPIHRSVSNPQDYKQSVTRSFNITPNHIAQNSYRPASSRQSRATFKYNDDRDESNRTPSQISVRLPTTTMRSNSSDKVLDLRRTPQPTSTSFNDYDTEDYSVRRSLSAEMVQDQIIIEQHSAPIRRQVPISPMDYDESNQPSYSQNSPDPAYEQSNPARLSKYLNQIPPSTIDASRKNLITDRNSASPVFEMSPPDTEHVYNVRSPLNRRHDNLSPTRTISTNSTQNQYYTRDRNMGSYSDDNSSSPPPSFIQRRNTDTNRFRRSELVVETDDDYDAQNPVFIRAPTVRSQSNDRLTEKKRVRFADMEGFTLETSDREQQQRAMDYRLYTGPTNTDRLNDFRRTNQPYSVSVYPVMGRNGNVIESKLATDV